MSAYKSNLYIDPVINIIGSSTHVLDLGQCPAIERLTFTSLVFINDAQTLLAGFSEYLL